MPGVIPTLEKILIYDDGQDGISKTEADIGAVLRAYTKPSESVTSTKLSDWRCDRSDDAKVCFLVSIETEEFHTTVKQLLRPENSNVLVLLHYDANMEQFVDGMIKDIKKAAKGKVKEKQQLRMRQVEEKIVKVTDLSDTNVWWPTVVSFLCGNGNSIPGRMRRHKKEIGVSYLFDDSDEAQLSWFSRQRRTLEDGFQIRCLRMDPDQDCDKYVLNSDCVVMYLSSVDLVTRYKHRQDLLTEAQKKVLSSAERHNCRLRVFVNKIVPKMDRKLVKATDRKLKIAGAGDLEFWLGLLQDLRLVNLQPLVDKTFYSNVPDKSYRAHYQQPVHYDRLTTAREGYLGAGISGPTEIDMIPVHGDSIHGDSSNALKHVCYTMGYHDNDVDVKQTKARSQDGVQDTLPRVSCCSFFPLLFRRNY